MLSAVTVTNNLDLVNGDTSSIANLVANDGGDGIALREAIEAANNTAGADEITFDFGHDGPETILLELGELEITDALTLTGNGADLLTIDAQHGVDGVPATYDGSRIFNIDDGDNDNDITTNIGGLTLTGADTSVVGGAIFNQENLSVTDSNISANSAGWGGAIFSRAILNVVYSTISGNSTIHHGGGIYNAGGTLAVVSSTFSENSTIQGNGGGIQNRGTATVVSSSLSGNSADGGATIGSGGGMYSRGTATITGTTFSDNSAKNGGGLFNYGTAIVTTSTISGNMAIRHGGGGVYNFFGDAIINESTISGNTGEFGGGIFVRSGTASLDGSTLSANTSTYGGGVFNNRGSISVASSTLSGNMASLRGGGFVNYNGTVNVASSTLSGNSANSGGGIYNYLYKTGIVTNSLVAGNMADSGPDLFGTFSGTYTLIGDGTGMTGLVDSVGGNQVGNEANPIDPMLGPLADNGGPTMTHALLPGSPAIDAGDPAFVAPPYLDQRGFYRVVDGDGDMAARIDMGAFEFGSVAAKPGDGNLDGVVDGLDYILWAMHFGDDPASDPPGAPLNGDFNDDGVVDGLDYVVWAMNFELTTLPVASVNVRPSTATTSGVLATDAVLEHDYNGGGSLDGNAVVRDWQIGRAMDLVFAKKQERGKF